MTDGDEGVGGQLDLSGHVALVTGAGRNIGRGVAQLLARAGAAVVVNDVDPARAGAVADEIRDHGCRAVGLAADVTDRHGVGALAEQAEQAFGRPIDILVNNAGNAGAGGVFDLGTPFWESDPGDWARWFDVNLFGVLNVSRAVLPAMVDRGWGRIITIVSDAGRVGEPFLVPYSAAKAGAAGFVRALAREAGRHGVTVNALSLGTVREEVRELSEADIKQLRRYVVRRFGTPDDVASAALFLASPMSAWITGQTIPVNGGYSMAL